MSMLIVYSSRTGNTKMLADAIHESFGDQAVIAPVEQAPDPAAFSAVAIGFWVDKGKPDAAAQEFMARVAGKDVGLFGTLGAWPDSAHARECLAWAVESLERSGNRVVCRFLCMGKVDPALLAAMAAMPDAARRHPMTPERQARLAEAAKHPDVADLEQVRTVFSAAFAGREAVAGQ